MELNVKISHSDILSKVLGTQDRNLNVFRQYLGVKITIDGEKILTNANGNIKDLVERVFEVLIKLANMQITLNERDVMYVIKLAEEKLEDKIFDLYHNRKRIIITDRGKSVYPKTINQQIYANEIFKRDLIFGVGPAGTGKTYIAVAMAAELLKTGKIKKIVLTRPAVEAGEALGFLPGDLKEKVDPYLIPLYDALYEFLGKDQTDNLILKGVIEIAPLAYMRGRTLDNAFVILDEAQNTTNTQMKMFLTRLGFNSKMVITGDPSQVDLPRGRNSGLKNVIELLKNIEDIKFVTFEKIDVIRHPLVQKILERYENEN
ncbi:MAG TPA: PhoH family protein [Acholeplasmataceae bacterium]|nr:PhoH family protein [Acholeplasmataceae bacterium]